MSFSLLAQGITISENPKTRTDSNTKNKNRHQLVNFCCKNDISNANDFSCVQVSLDLTHFRRI
jgi:hypothetical protein